MDNRAYKRVSAVLLLLVFLLTACGKEAAQVSPQEKTDAGEIKWKVKETILPDADEALMSILSEGGSSYESLCEMAGGTIYRIVNLLGREQEYKGICIQRLAAPYTEWDNTSIMMDDWVENEQCYMISAAARQDGSIHILLKEIQGNYYMAEWTKETGHIVSPVPEGVFGEEYLSGIGTYYVDADDNTYICTEDGLQYYDKAFDQKKEWAGTEYVSQIMESPLPEKSVYLCGSSPADKFRIWTLKTREPVISSDDVSIGMTAKAVFADETEGFLCTCEGVWQFSLQEGQVENILTFAEQDCTVDRMLGASILEDGTLIMAAVSGKFLVLLEKQEDSGGQDKVELEFAIAYATPFMQQVVVDFNKQREDCRIVLRTNPEEQDYEDYLNRIQAEVSGGGGPALLSDDVINLQQAEERGFLMDLTEDFAGSRNSMLENVRAAGEKDGKTYAVPYSFSVMTMLTSADIVGERKNWDGETMIQYLRSTGVEAAIGNYDSAWLFDFLALNGRQGGEFVDWENKKSRLNSSEAVSLIELAKQYGDKGASGDRGWGVRIGEGEILTNLVTVGGFSMPQYIHGTMQGKEVYIGFPVENGRNGSWLRGDLIAVNQSCEYPEGAIAFIQYLLSEEIQDELGREAVAGKISHGFPVRSESFDNMFDHAKEEQEHDTSMHYPINENDGSFLFNLEPLEGEDLEKLRELLLNAGLGTEELDVISEIIHEEAGAYFYGDMSAQEVCDKIQNKVQLYLDEMK